MLNNRLQNTGENRRARSPPHLRFPEQPVDTRPLPENWIRRRSNTIDPGRIYYFNVLTGESRWDFPDLEEERRRTYAEHQDSIQRLQAARQARIRSAEAERQERILRAEAESQALILRAEARNARILRAEAERQALLEEEEEEREKLENVNKVLEITNHRYVQN